MDESHAPSAAGTEGDSASATEAALMQAQRAQREAMLVGQTSLNDSHKRLMEMRQALQHNDDHAELHDAGDAELQGVIISCPSPG